MKKTFIWGAMVVAAIALVSCNKEQDVKNEVPQGIPFEIIAGTEETRTVNNEMKTEWKEGDKINLFHAVNGADPYTYNYDGAFTATADGASVKFNGTLVSDLDGSSHYDWYALYPYVDDTHNTPAQFDYITIGSVADGAQQQVGNDSKAHLAGVGYPLWGKKTNLAASTKPAINMKQMTAIIAVKVTNTIDDAITVSKVDFSCSSEGDLIGEYRVNFSGNNPVFETATTSNIATLNVSEAAALAKTEYAVYYLAVKPFTATAGSKLEIGIYTNKGNQVLANIVPSNFNFNAGKIYTLDCSFTNKDVDLAEFKYNDATWLAGQGISLPESGQGTELGESVQTVAPISVQTLDVGTSTKVWNDGGNYEMRIYKKDKILVSASGNNFITKITLGSSTSLSGVSANSGVFSADSKTWTGKSLDVTFTLSDDMSTTKIKSIGVFYKAAEENDHLVSIPVHEKNVTFAAGSVDFAINTCNVSDLVFSHEGDGYISHSWDGSNLTVNYAQNTTTSPRNIVVTVSSESAVFEEVITITQGASPVNSISLIKNQYSGSDIEVEASLTNALVTMVNGNNFYLEDASGAIIGRKSEHGLVAGDMLNGKITGTLKKYNNNYQIDGCDFSEATVTHGNTVTPATVAFETLVENFDAYESRYVRVNGLSITSSSGYNYHIEEDENFIIYNRTDVELTPGSEINVVGIACFYNETKEITMFTLADDDLIAIGSVINASDKEVAAGNTVSIEATTNSPATITYSSANTGIATVSSTGVITGVAVGSTTITCSVAASGKYLAGSKVITVTVTAGGDPTWTRVTSVSQITAGDTFIIGYENDNKNNKGVIVPMRQETGNNLVLSGTTAGSSTNGTISMPASSGTLPSTTTAAYETVIVAGKNTGVAIMIGNQYIKDTASASKNQCSFVTTLDGDCDFTPTIGNNDVVTFTSTRTVNKSGTNYNPKFQFNNASNSYRFTCYTTGGQKNLVLYKKSN